MSRNTFTAFGIILAFLFLVAGFIVAGMVKNQIVGALLATPMFLICVGILIAPKAKRWFTAPHPPSRSSKHPPME